MSTSGRGGLVPAPGSCWGGTAQPVSPWGCVQGRAPHTAPWEPLCPQGWEGSRLAGLHPQVCHRWIWGVVLPTGCPGTHPARHRQLLPRGVRGARGAQSQVPILAVGTREELGQCGPGCPTGEGLGSARGTRVTPGHGPACFLSVPPAARSDLRRGLGSQTHRSLRCILFLESLEGDPSAGDGKGGTASPSRSIPAYPLGPAIHRSPQAPPGLYHPQQGILTRSCHRWGRRAWPPPPSPPPWDDTEEGMGMGTGTAPAFTWG